jgi:hypothetical protein
MKKLLCNFLHHPVNYFLSCTDILLWTLFSYRLGVNVLCSGSFTTLVTKQSCNTDLYILISLFLDRRQMTATGPFPKLAESGPHNHTRCHPIYTWISQGLLPFRFSEHNFVLIIWIVLWRIMRPNHESPFSCYTPRPFPPTSFLLSRCTRVTCFTSITIFVFHIHNDAGLK